MLRLAHQVGSLVASSRNPPTVLRLASPPPQPSGFKSQPPTMLRLASPPPQPPSSSSTSSNSLRMNMESTRNSEGSFHGENTNSSQQKDNLEVHGRWNQNGEAAPLTAEKVRSAAKAGLATAATKAKLFADHEEREIQRLSANIANHPHICWDALILRKL
ncbi:SWI/SNF complex subunit SWI3C [Camellia lanceoleosa]|nr:SWI/SNF complex subunit SWI3C [Camellia lanceoleosa]